MAKAIQENNWLYNLLCPLVQFGTRCHYNSFIVHGLSNLPSDGAYIIAPCHQQALMEPLAVLRFAPKPPVFLARADLFAKPTLRAILTFLRIMPVYRIRDGQDKLGRNQEIFDRCREVLIDGYPLCLMAEGRHNNRHHLLNMGKGMFRIAGETQQALGKHPLYIVPTGIDFDEYERPYSNLVVNIGLPIPVQPFMDTYRENEPLALNQMRDTLSERLLPLMHDIRNEEFYNETMTLCNILNREIRHREGLKNTAWNRFLLRQRIAQRMDTASLDDGLLHLVSEFQHLCHHLHINEKTVAEHWSLTATLLSLLAFAALLATVLSLPVLRATLFFCLLCYPLPLIPTHLIVRRKVSDPQFRSSFNFGIRFFLSILYAIIIGIVMACCNGAWMSKVMDIGAWWGLIAVLIVLLGARIAGPTTDFLRETAANCRYWSLRLCRHRTMQSLLKTYNSILSHYAHDKSI